MPPDNPDPEQIEEAGRIIREGGLVAFPTETVYGLGGNALDPAASQKIYAAKGRPSDNPLIVHIADWEALDRIAAEVPQKALMLGRIYWPGPLTMIFSKTEEVPYETTGGLDTVAVRFPSHKVAQALIRASGGYIAAPSANLSGRPSPTKAVHVIEDLGDRIDAVIDGGDADIGLESTIVDFTEDVPVLLRPGYISVEKLREALGEIRVDPGIIADNSGIIPKAPGMKYRHYAPKGTLSVVEGRPEDVIRTINSLTEEAEKAGRSCAVLCADETASSYRGKVYTLGCRADEEEVAAALFDTLRQLDTDGVEYIYSEAFPSENLGAAIMNRLLKAAGHRIIHAGEESL